MDSAPWTVARLLSWTREYFTRGGVESPRLCAELLLAHAMGCERIHLYTRHDEVPAEQILAPFRELVREAARGVPIAYLVGTKEFFSLPFSVTRDVLIPRPETEILVERTINLVRSAGPANARIIDLGTGSGCIAISLARHLPEARLCASDVSEEALTVARRNAETLDVAQRVELRAGDLFTPWCIADDEPALFDIIVCNPPYVATSGAPIDKSVREHEPAGALFAGNDGMEIIRRVLAEAPQHLVAGGHLLLEMAFDQGQRVREQCTSGGYWEKVVTYRDGAGHERVLHAQRGAAEHSQVA